VHLARNMQRLSEVAMAKAKLLSESAPKVGTRPPHPRDSSSTRSYRATSRAACRSEGLLAGASFWLAALRSGVKEMDRLVSDRQEAVCPKLTPVLNHTMPRQS
jgi:hypothetical protein